MIKGMLNLTVFTYFWQKIKQNMKLTNFSLFNGIKKMMVK